MTLFIVGSVMVLIGLYQAITGGPAAGKRGISWQRDAGFSTRLHGVPADKLPRYRLVSAIIAGIGVVLVLLSLVTPG